MKNKRKKAILTVLTVTYNHERYIREALDSILSQKTDFDFNILISDDHSTDKTPKIILEYSKKYPKKIFPIFNKINLGSMRNYLGALDRINSKYLAICDGDDYWSNNNKLQQQVDFLENNPSFSICFHQTKIFFENGTRPDEIFPRSDFPVTTGFNELIKDNFIPANTAVYRWAFGCGKSIKNIVPDFIIPGDYFVNLLHAQTGDMHFIAKIMSNYRRHEDSVWWDMVNNDGIGDFIPKYGLQYLRFFYSIESVFGLNKSLFWNKKVELTTGLMDYFYKNKMYDELPKLRELNRLTYNYCVSKQYKRPIKYYCFSPPRKLLYILSVEPLTLLRKYLPLKANQEEHSARSVDER